MIPSPLRAGRNVLLLAFALPLVSACSDSATETRLNQLKRAEALWARTSGSANYSADQARICFCPDPQGARITVTNGQIVSGIESQTGKPLQAGQLVLFRTVPQTFADIRTALALKGARVDVSYDPALGYPTRFYVDPDVRAADEEYGFDTYGLVKIPN